MHRILSSVLTLLLFTAPIEAQEHHSTATLKQPISNAAVIDGSRNPELIPNSVAQELILKAWAEPSVRSTEAAARQKAKLAVLGLQPSEHVALVRIIADFQQKIGDLEDRYRASLTRASDSASLEAEKGEIVAASAGEIQKALSDDSNARFLSHIQHEKAKMRIIPFPKMTR